MSQNQIVAILVLTIGLIVTIASILTYWISNQKKQKTFARAQRSQFLYFLKKYFWIMLFAFGVLIIITGVTLAIKFL